MNEATTTKSEERVDYTVIIGNVSYRQNDRDVACGGRALRLHAQTIGSQMKARLKYDVR